MNVVPILVTLAFLGVLAWLYRRTMLRPMLLEPRVEQIAEENLPASVVKTLTQADHIFADMGFRPSGYITSVTAASQGKLLVAVRTFASERTPGMIGGVICVSSPPHSAFQRRAWAEVQAVTASGRYISASNSPMRMGERNDELRFIRSYSHVRNPAFLARVVQSAAEQGDALDPAWSRAGAAEFQDIYRVQIEQDIQSGYAVARGDGQTWRMSLTRLLGLGARNSSFSQASSEHARIAELQKLGISKEEFRDAMRWKPPRRNGN